MKVAFVSAPRTFFWYSWRFGRLLTRALKPSPRPTWEVGFDWVRSEDVLLIPEGLLASFAHFFERFSCTPRAPRQQTRSRPPGHPVCEPRRALSFWAARLKYHSLSHKPTIVKRNRASRGPTAARVRRSSVYVEIARRRSRRAARSARASSPGGRLARSQAWQFSS